jgi:hypothetical protein
MTRGVKPAPLPFLLPSRLMRELGPVIYSLLLAMLDAGHDLLERRPVTAR